jgi:hypothetical protein
MPDAKRHLGHAIRLIASGGWTTEDPDVLGGLVDRATLLADAVVADETCSAEVRALAQEFLLHVEADRSD